MFIPRAALLTVGVLLAATPSLSALPASAATAPQEFLVAVDGDPEALRQEIAAAGGSVEQVYGELDMLAVTLPDAAADALDELRGVEVEPNPVLRAFPAPSFGLDRIDQRSLPLSSTYTYPANAAGAGVDVYVMDTGVRSDHAQFGGRVAPGFSAYADGLGTGDCNGHGTHVAGTIAGGTVGVAPAARIVPVRVLDCTGSTTTGFEFLDGMDWVLAHHQPGTPAVLNLSMGSTASSIIDDATAEAVADGITVVAAAGNSNADACGTSPARAPSALTVAASTAADTRAAYSNFGTCVDLFAPGGDGSARIHSAGKDSSTAIVGMVGTSMAAPHVAGAAARYLSANPAAAPNAVASAILALSTPNVVGSAGAGTPNRLLYVPSDWFAVESPAVGSHVRPAYDRAGGAGGYLGRPTGAETCGLAGGGCSQEFQGGTITWTPSAGAAALDGAIRAVWRGSGSGGGWLGYPVESPVCGTGGACVQDFQNGSVVWTAARGAVPIDGAIWRTWVSSGAETGTLGLPLAAPACTAAGCVHRFERGEIRWNGATGAHAFTSAPVRAAYDSLRGAAGYLRQPTSSTTCSASGCSQTFQGGTVLAAVGAPAAYAVDGAMLSRWHATGGVAGPLGYPTANPMCGNGCTQRFERGAVLWSSGSGAAALLDGAVATEYRRLGGTAGYLGWPTGDTRCGLAGGGCTQQFARGAIYGSSAGAYALDGAILTRWRATGAETGSLGYPTSSPVKVAASPLTYRQTFERGRITWTAARGAVVG